MCMKWIYILVIVGSLILGTESFISVELEVEHCFGDNNFKKAGTLKGGITTTGYIVGTFQFNRLKLTKDDKIAFQKLLKNNDYYTIQISSIPAQSGSSHKIMASIRSRCLLNSNFNENMTLHLTEDNKIIGLDYYSGKLPCDIYNENNEIPDLNKIEFSHGPIEVDYVYPHTSSFMSTFNLYQGNNEQVAVEAGTKNPDQFVGSSEKAQKPKKTWLQQNWLFVLGGALLILQLLGSLNEAVGTAQQQQQQGSVGGNAAQNQR